MVEQAGLFNTGIDAVLVHLGFLHRRAPAYILASRTGVLSDMGVVPWLMTLLNTAYDNSSCFSTVFWLCFR